MQRLRDIWSDRRFVPLFFTMVVMLVGYPLLDESATFGRALIDAVYSLVMIGALLAVLRERRGMALAMLVLGGLSLGTRVAHRMSDIPLVTQLVFASTTLFYLLVLVTLLRYIIFAKRVDTNTVFAAMCTYLMLGMVWFFLYRIVLAADPGAFTGTMIAGDGVEEIGRELFYFSFVTLTTLGYGDISPVAPLACSLAVLEAVMGQLFVAVLLARMVAMQLKQRDHTR